MTSPEVTSPLTPDDIDALAAVARGNAWARSLLCTLARRGVAVRQREPGRAQTVLAALAPWPWFKAGQFLFDLLEWEDFMVDGAPPPILPGALDAAAVARLGRLLRQAQSLFDGAAGDALSALQGLDLTGMEIRAMLDLPPLEPGLYLYRDVVLGAFVALGPLFEARRAAAERDTDTGETGD